MHDIDRTQLEYSQEMPGFQSEQFEYGETEWSGEMLGESVLSEAQEIQLAGELLEVTNEAELDRFLGDFIKKVGSVAGQVIRSPIGQAVGGVLKGVAKKALPIAGGAIGGYFGGPLGAKIGSGLAIAAGSALGLEAEQLEQEDREFEGARQFVRVAADTVKAAAARRQARIRARWPRRRRSRRRGSSRPALVGQAADAGRGPGRHAAGRSQAAAGCVAAARSSSTACRRRWRSAPTPRGRLSQEARALLTRLARVRSFALVEPMLPAANLLPGDAGRHRAPPRRRQAPAPQGRATTFSHGCAGRRRDKRPRLRRSAASRSSS